MSNETKIERSCDRVGPEPAAADGTSAFPAGDGAYATAAADGTSALRDGISVSPVGWTYRGYLPHFDDQDTPQFITFRLADSMPADVIEGWKRELGLDELSQHSDNSKTSQANRKLRERIEKYLDCGYGDCLLKHHENAELVANALQHFDGIRYQLFAWVIMPNHVHVLCRQKSGWPLSKIIRSWKSFTAHAINKSFARTGAFWQADYFDRYIRNDAHFLAVAHYIETNPVSAGLCTTASEWPYSSTRRTEDVPCADRSTDVPSALLAVRPEHPNAE
ncbi:MAG: transposase [Planctomycetaceae bacterium]|nr:transposase [Planctomycetaceae bacterium]